MTASWELTGFSGAGADGSRALPTQLGQHQDDGPHLHADRSGHCGVCGHRMQGNPNHGENHYRCRYPRDFGPAAGMDHPRTVYVREAAVVPKLEQWVMTVQIRHWCARGSLRSRIASCGTRAVRWFGGHSTPTS